jgi:hypothetical protein
VGVLVLLALGALGIWQAAGSQIGPLFLLYLLPIFLAFTLVPLFIYRAYALWRASYTLQRDGIQLKWGLREENIPMDVVLWVRPVEELDLSLPLPRLRWPGAVIGLRKLPDGTQIEFLAAQTRHLILISITGKIFAISPYKPDEFMLAYHRFAEFGSLSPLPAHSAYPASLLRQVWASSWARFLLLSGFIASLLLLVLASLIIPTRPTISLGFLPDGSPSDEVPSVRLLILPLLNSFFYLANALLGLNIFRSAEWKTLAYLLWGGGLFTALLFLIAALFLITAF